MRGPVRDEREIVEAVLAYLAATNPALAAFLQNFAIAKSRSAKTAYFDAKRAAIVVPEKWLRKVSLDNYRTNKGYITKGEFAALLLHEMFHGSLNHWVPLIDKKDLNPIIWNIASDVEVNSILEDLPVEDSTFWDFLVKFGERLGGTPVSWRTFRDKGVKKDDPAEIVYAKLLEYGNEIKLFAEADVEICDEEGCRGGSSYDWRKSIVMPDLIEGKSDDVKEIFKGNKEFREMFKESIKRYESERDPSALEELGKEVTTRLAATMLKLAGNLPGSLKRFVKPYKHQMKWEQILKGIIARGSVKDYRTWSVPNRRGLKYVPGYSKRGAKVWFLVDVSGSISDEELSAFVGELVHAAKYSKINLVIWDAEPKLLSVGASRSRILSVIRRGIEGGGGTVISEALELVKNNLKPNEPVIILTDGYWYDDDEDTVRLMKEIKRISGNVLLVTTAITPQAAKEAGWRSIRLRLDDSKPWQEV